MIKTITEVTCDICSKREVVDRTDTWGCIRLDNDKTMEICNKCGERPIRELIEVCKKIAHTNGFIDYDDSDFSYNFPFYTTVSKSLPDSYVTKSAMMDMVLNPLNWTKMTNVS